MQVIIMRGVPGSGKSSYISRKCPDAFVCSADNFFMNPNESGELVYQFDAKQLNDAHSACFLAFRDACARGMRKVVVDNTNTRLFEMSPYVMLARSYGYKIKVVHCTGRLEACAQRNVHGVGFTSIKRMSETFEPTPPFWWAEEETYTWLG